MAPCCSSRLNADAPLFVPQATSVPEPAPFVSYGPPPPVPDVLPPVGLRCPFMGPPPPPGFLSAIYCLPPAPKFQCPAPPPGLPGTFAGRPPVPGFPVSWTPLWRCPQGPAMVMPPPIRHDVMARPAAPAQVPQATPPQQARLTATTTDGDKVPAGSARTWRATSGRRRSKRLMRRQLGAAKRALVMGSEAVGEGDDGETNLDHTNVDSPRSVLHSCSPSVPPTEAQHGRPLPPKKASAPGVRLGDQRPRREFNPAGSLTTLMIRNIPNGFTRQKVMNIIDQHCAEENEKIAAGGSGGGVVVKSEYDFLYVPFDFRTKANKGYCFVNVTSPEAALRLWQYLHGYRWTFKDSRKVCEVVYATIQGRKELVAHFSGSCFDCHTEEFLPVWFSPPRNGARPAVSERHVVGRLGRRMRWG